MLEEEKTQVEDRCPGCGSKKLITDHESHEIVCQDCGVVEKENVFDTRPERAFGEEEKSKIERHGPMQTLAFHDKSLSTVIDYSGKDAAGRRLTPRIRLEMYKLRKWQTRTRFHGAEERSLAHGLLELRSLESKLNLTESVKENAAANYRKAIKKNLIRGRDIKEVMSSCIYYSCRINGIPITMDDIIRASSIKLTKKIIYRNLSVLMRELGLENPEQNVKIFNSKTCNKLEISGNVKSASIKIAQLGKKYGLHKSPTGLSAASVYIACCLTGERRKYGYAYTQRDIAEIGEVTEVTIRNIYKELVGNVPSHELSNVLEEYLADSTHLSEEEKKRRRKFGEMFITDWAKYKERSTTPSG